MVITRLAGGLGNQLFQYAAGRALAERLRTELKMDRFPLETGHRRYELGAFALAQEFATLEEVRRYVPPYGPLARTVWHLRRGGRPGLRDGYFAQAGFHFDARFLEVSGDLYLDGYWQSEKYFPSGSGLREALTAVQPPSADSEGWAAQIEGCESVSVHVRRGDAVSSPQGARVHGSLPLTYHRRAAELLTALVAAPTFFVFSDEIDYVRPRLNLPGTTHFVSDPAAPHTLRDFGLMRRCRHHIIANSTYSWWAAWLGEHDSKVVIGPRRWFNVPEFNTMDLFPDGWIAL